MNIWRATIGLLLAAVGCLAGSSPVRAQGLIWSLPKDGTWVRYEGTYKQIEISPNLTEGGVTLNWIQHLTIKSVGSEVAEYHGSKVPCRWIEMKVVTGKASEAGVDPGPVGSRVYKILVPETRIVGKLTDNAQIPVDFIDVVKGFRKIGDGDVEPIKAGALQVYPLIALVMNYDALTPEGAASVDPQIRFGSVSAKQFKAVSRMESPTVRTSNEAHLWLCNPKGPGVPFGLAKWTIKTVRESKDSSEPRPAFKRVSEVTAEMSAHESGEGATSDLVDAGSPAAPVASPTKKPATPAPAKPRAAPPAKPSAAKSPPAAARPTPKAPPKSPPKAAPKSPPKAPAAKSRNSGG